MMLLWCHFFLSSLNWQVGGPQRKWSINTLADLRLLWFCTFHTTSKLITTPWILRTSFALHPRFMRVLKRLSANATSRPGRVPRPTPRARIFRIPHHRLRLPRRLQQRPNSSFRHLSTVMTTRGRQHQPSVHIGRDLKHARPGLDMKTIFSSAATAKVCRGLWSRRPIFRIAPEAVAGDDSRPYRPRLLSGATGTTLKISCYQSLWKNTLAYSSKPGKQFQTKCPIVLGANVNHDHSRLQRATWFARDSPRTSFLKNLHTYFSYHHPNSFLVHTYFT